MSISINQVEKSVEVLTKRLVSMGYEVVTERYNDHIVHQSFIDLTIERPENDFYMGVQFPTNEYTVTSPTEISTSKGMGVAINEFWTKFHEEIKLQNL